MSSAPPSGFPGGQPVRLTNDDLLYYIDMSLVGVLGLVTLIYLPRTIVRYTNKSTLREGWMLLRGNSQYPRPSMMRGKDLSTLDTSTIQYPPNRSVSVDVFPPASSTQVSHINRTPTINARLLGSEHRGGSGSPPPHIRGYLSYVPFVGRVLEYHILGYRVGQLI
ncbi:hypothetical protein FRC06_006855, partial [Ceratobasidium sp. 370]